MENRAALPPSTKASARKEKEDREREIEEWKLRIRLLSRSLLGLFLSVYLMALLLGPSDSSMRLLLAEE